MKRWPTRQAPRNTAPYVSVALLMFAPVRAMSTAVKPAVTTSDTGRSPRSSFDLSDIDVAHECDRLAFRPGVMVEHVLSLPRVGHSGRGHRRLVLLRVEGHPERQV